MLVRRRNLVAAAIAVTIMGSTTATLAHHGWSWAEGEQMELKGTVETISMSPPHPTLHVKASDGTVWRVDLGNPNQTARSGFNADTANVGDAIIVIGNRNKDRTQAHMKAVRIVLNGNNYDIYPGRIQEG